MDKYTLSLVEARILVLASQCPPAENYAEFLAAKLKTDASYTASRLRRLALAGLILYERHGRRRIVTNVDKTALEEAKDVLQQQQQQHTQPQAYHYI